MALWELLAPRRPLSTSKGARWLANLGLVLIDTVALRLFFPITLAAFAHLLKLRGWGLLNKVSLPSGMLVALGVIGLDLLIYLQHTMFHAIPAFWRLHLVHHTHFQQSTHLSTDPL